MAEEITEAAGTPAPKAKKKAPLTGDAKMSAIVELMRANGCSIPDHLED